MFSFCFSPVSSSTPVVFRRFLPAVRRAATALILLFCLGFLGSAPPASAQMRLSIPIIGSDQDTLTYSGAADVRYRETDKEPRGSYISATRLTADWIRRPFPAAAAQGGARAQVYLETDNSRDKTIGHLRFSDLYIFYDFRLPGVAARVKAGQFPLPFGLTALYDPLQPIQPLYEKSLGLRLDTGVMLEGEYGDFLYAAALTTGAGPNRIRSDRLITFRLERTVVTELGKFIVGGSLLSGRAPVTGFDTQLPASGTSDAREFIEKTRFAGDGQYFFGPLILRGEIMFGGDGPDPVWGYFAEGNYRFAPRLTAVATRRLWVFPAKPQTASSTGIGLNYDIGNGLTIRTLYEFQRDVPLPEGTPPFVNKRFTVQTRLSF